jgi:uncharacterized protein DUF5906
MAQAMSLDKLREQIHKCPEGMIDSAPPGSQPKAFLLADRICRWCEENKHASPYGTVFTPDHFSIQVATAWQTDTAHRYFKANIRPPAVVEDAQAHGKGDDSVWEQPGTLAFQDASANLLSSKFIVSQLTDGVMQLYQILDWQQREVSAIGGKAEDVNTVISRAVVDTLRADGVAVTSEKLSLMKTAFLATSKLQPRPNLLGQPGDDDWCVYRARVLPDASVDFPHFRSFLDRLNDPCAFAAWWWGVYSGRNKGRQSIYLWDQRGEGAKSVILKTLGSLFGNRIYASFPTSVSLADGFTSSAFVNKKLVVVGDCKDSYILHRGMLKELSGDDLSWINAKYQQPYSTHLECRVVIASNHAPFIIGQAHNTSRTLFLIVSPLTIKNEDRDVEYGDKCQRELPGFLHYARECYSELCPNHYAIRTNQAVEQATLLRIAQCESVHAETFAEHFVVDQQAVLHSKQWNGKMKELKMQTHQAADFLEWIKAMVPSHTERALLRGAWELEGVTVRGAKATTIMAGAY